MALSLECTGCSRERIWPYPAREGQWQVQGLTFFCQLTHLMRLKSLLTNLPVSLSYLARRS